MTEPDVDDSDLEARRPRTGALRYIVSVSSYWLRSLSTKARLFKAVEVLECLNLSTSSRAQVYVEVSSQLLYINPAHYVSRSVCPGSPLYRLSVVDYPHRRPAHSWEAVLMRRFVRYVCPINRARKPS